MNLRIKRLLVIGALELALAGVVVMAAHPAFALNHWIRNDGARIVREYRVSREKRKLNAEAERIQQCINRQLDYSHVVGYGVAYSTVTGISTLNLHVMFNRAPDALDPESALHSMYEGVDVMLECALKEPEWDGLRIISGSVRKVTTHDDGKAHVIAFALGGTYMGLREVVQEYYDLPYEERSDYMTEAMMVGRMADDQILRLMHPDFPLGAVEPAELVKFMAKDKAWHDANKAAVAAQT